MDEGDVAPVMDGLLAAAEEARRPHGRRASVRGERPRLLAEAFYTLSFAVLMNGSRVPVARAIPARATTAVQA